MAGYLIAETTREEREKIVAESLGNIEANCDGCMAGPVSYTHLDVYKRQAVLFRDSRLGDHCQG